MAQTGWIAWLGRKGSNLRMLESKSSALPLGDAPKAVVRPGPYRGGQGLSTRRKCRNLLPNAWKFLLFCSVAGEGGHGYKGAPARQRLTAVRHRRVAQPGRALRSGRRGRRFRSSLSDQLFHQMLFLVLCACAGRIDQARLNARACAVCVSKLATRNSKPSHQRYACLQPLSMKRNGARICPPHARGK